MIDVLFIAALSTILFVIFFFAYEIHKQKALRALLEERFKGVLDADEEERKIRERTAETQKKLDSLLEELNKYQKIMDAKVELTNLQTLATEERNKIEALRRDYSSKREVYLNLVKEIAIFDEKLSFAEMGVYEPHFDFTDSEKYKSEIIKLRDQEKSLISNERAVICTSNWSVDGSQAKGKTMTNRNIKLTLRAFNNECEAAIANVRWSNANSMEKRIIRAQEQIDKLNASNAIFVTSEYLKLKLKELQLTHELREKQKEEKEQKAEAARLSREEQKLIKDMEDAEKEEARYQKLLDKAKAEASEIAGPQLEAFTQQIAILEKDLAEAHAKVERAQAMAERTRSGYVYIISNVGSFGEDVVKIGLTRRLDPADRVRELGDASVPFIFDTHAIIYSDDAPSLERALHVEFDKLRINAQNYRKEFFKVSLEEVEQAVKRLAPDAAFFKDIEAQEYYETLSRRQTELLKPVEVVEKFPVAI